jgi:2-succinyl-6-hydroxy-2,4-cyclohexadiene-1-carboxylate synthase
MMITHKAVQSSHPEGNHHWCLTRAGDPLNPPFLLLHGFMGSGEDWDELIINLSRDFYCLTINLPGHRSAALSDCPAPLFPPSEKGLGDEGHTLDIPQIAEAIIALLLDDRPINLLGYSLGGRIALYLALHYPDRCQKVVLESASWGLPTASERQARRKSDEAIARKLRRPDLDWPAFIDHWYQQPVFTGIIDHPHFPALHQRRLHQDPPSLANSLASAGLGTQPYLKDQLTLNQLPLLLLVGEWDKKFVDIGQQMAAACPLAKLSIVPQCSHNVHFQQPDRWLQSVQEFLA